MPIKLRFQRFGTANRPHYRLVAADSRVTRDKGQFEVLGGYTPEANREKVKTVNLRVDRIKHWITKGAQPSEAVQTLLYKAGIFPMPYRMAAYSRMGLAMNEYNNQIIPEYQQKLKEWQDFYYPLILEKESRMIEAKRKTSAAAAASAAAASAAAAAIKEGGRNETVEAASI